MKNSYREGLNMKECPVKCTVEEHMTQRRHIIPLLTYAYSQSTWHNNLGLDNSIILWREDPVLAWIDYIVRKENCISRDKALLKAAKKELNFLLKAERNKKDV